MRPPLVVLLPLAPRPTDAPPVRSGRYPPPGQLLEHQEKRAESPNGIERSLELDWRLYDARTARQEGAR